MHVAETQEWAYPQCPPVLAACWLLRSWISGLSGAHFRFFCSVFCLLLLGVQLFYFRKPTEGPFLKPLKTSHIRRNCKSRDLLLTKVFFSLPCFYIPVILLMIYMMFLSYSKIIILFLFFRKHRDDMTLDIRLNEKEKQNIQNCLFKLYHFINDQLIVLHPYQLH